MVAGTQFPFEIEMRVSAYHLLDKCASFNPARLTRSELRRRRRRTSAVLDHIVDVKGIYYDENPFETSDGDITYERLGSNCNTRHLNREREHQI